MTHVKGQLSPDVQKLVDQVDPGTALPAAAQETLLADLNRLIQTTNLYNAEAFQSVTLKKGTANLAKLVQAKGEKPDIILLNRQLVEQLFPGAILELQKTIDKCKSRGTLLQDVGSMLGMLAFTWVASRFNRRTAFFASFAFCWDRGRVRVLLAQAGDGRVLDAAADGLRHAVLLRGLLDLLPGDLPDPPAGHRRGLLLQHGPLPGGALPVAAGLAEHPDALPQAWPSSCA